MSVFAVAMPFVCNSDACCPICEGIYRSANSACVLSCVNQGCDCEMCFDCVHKSVFPGNKSNGATCPRCERVVLGYSYAFFAFYRNRSSMQDRLAALDTEVRDLKKQLAAAEAEVDDATCCVDEWRRWSMVAKARMDAMPPSDHPHAHTTFGSDANSEAIRSRSRRQGVRAARIV